MSLMHLLDAWLECEGHKRCYQHYVLDMDVLRVGKTYLGYIYRDTSGRKVLLVGKNVPDHMRNTIRSKTQSDASFHVRRITIEQIDKICRAYRSWSLSIEFRTSDRCYSINVDRYHDYLAELARASLPMPVIIPSLESPLFAAALENALEQSIRQLRRVQVIDAPYGVIFEKQRRAWGSLMEYQRFRIIDQLHNKEQMIIAQLQRTSDYEILLF